MHLDLYCEHLLREALYTAAFSWFSVRPQYVVPLLSLDTYEIALIIDTGGHLVQVAFRLTQT
jgi:hypothetical protein